MLKYLFTVKSIAPKCENIHWKRGDAKLTVTISSFIAILPSVSHNLNGVTKKVRGFNNFTKLIRTDPPAGGVTITLTCGYVNALRI